MGSFSSMDISASGLYAQRVRMDTIANNIANANTTRTAEGGPYKKHEVVFKTHMSDTDPNGGGVEVEGVIEDQAPPKMVYDPANPDANKQGMVAMPNVNIVTEMVDMMSATRAYEANVQAVNAAKSMATKALDIGR